MGVVAKQLEVELALHRAGVYPHDIEIEEYPDSIEYSFCSFLGETEVLRRTRRAGLECRAGLPGYFIVSTAALATAQATEYDMYKVDVPRQQLLEEFYQLMVSIDVIGGIKEQLMDEGEMETWGELTVLAGALQTRQPAVPATAQPATGGEGGADAYATYALESFTRARKGLTTIEGDTHPDYIAWLENSAYEDMLVAQDRIATLQTQLADARARAAAAEAAIKPFVALAESADVYAFQDPWYVDGNSTAFEKHGAKVTYADCQRLRDALARQTAGE